MKLILKSQENIETVSIQNEKMGIDFKGLHAEIVYFVDDFCKRTPFI